ncbi:MAG: 16S rRNA (cytosine(1402)-N(4))-methyltransferase RsmH [Clostridia bacterium]|nr:16S rRNA (cytosine(1402)-N(4))-methyltransferase RsmH [Clostridia bacterium]
MTFSHVSVLLRETIDVLNVREGGVYFDGTLGGGGHSSEIARRLGEKGLLLASDLDPNALKAAGERLSAFPVEKRFFQSNFKNFSALIAEAGVEKVDGVLLDLGVSSHQLDEKCRGFSYQEDAPLDMRMSDSGMTAADVVNTYSEADLRRVLFEYGEENNARAIARRIVSCREEKPFETTMELVECIRAAFGGRRTDKNPARRTFQALRIEVNGELSGLSDVLFEMADALNPGGVLAVITFHSLEDRIVKQAFRRMIDGCTCPREFPVCTCGFVQTVDLAFKKPVVASETELKENPRARSAKLRAVIKR